MARSLDAGSGGGGGDGVQIVSGGSVLHSLKFLQRLPQHLQENRIPGNGSNSTTEKSIQKAESHLKNTTHASVFPYVIDRAVRTLV